MITLSEAHTLPPSDMEYGTIDERGRIIEGRCDPDAALRTDGATPTGRCPIPEASAANAGELLNHYLWGPTGISWGGVSAVRLSDVSVIGMPLVT
eukprot:gene10072-11190_t